MSREQLEVLAQRLVSAERSSRQDYRLALSLMDAAVCEAIAVSQASANRYPAPCIAYGSYIFTRLCAYGVAAVRAAPLSRWVESESQEWGFQVLACHARAILEGTLYFHYFMSPVDEVLGEGDARITLMQLNDCCSRIKLFANDEGQRVLFEGQRDELVARLSSIRFFQEMSPQVQGQCLAGKKAWFLDRAQLVALVGMDKRSFDVLWDLWSQYAHIHPMSFYRMEANGRGTGAECDPDRMYLTKALMVCAGIIMDATDTMVDAFPDVANVRRGIDSRFSPGPRRNSRAGRR